MPQLCSYMLLSHKPVTSLKSLYFIEMLYTLGFYIFLKKQKICRKRGVLPADSLFILNYLLKGVVKKDLLISFILYSYFNSFLNPCDFWRNYCNNQYIGISFPNNIFYSCVQINLDPVFLQLYNCIR